VRSWVHFAVFSGALALAAVPAHAAEQITLRNGFEITCHHHGAVNNKVRLYTGSTNDNYIEVVPADIASVEHVPDPPVGGKRGHQGLLEQVTEVLEAQVGAHRRKA